MSKINNLCYGQLFCAFEPAEKDVLALIPGSKTEIISLKSKLVGIILKRNDNFHLEYYDVFLDGRLLHLYRGWIHLV